MQNQELAQLFEDLIEVADMDLELDKDIDMMLSALHVII